jgi:IS30 family transposase
MAGAYRYLTYEDRQNIEAWYKSGDRPFEIAARLGVHTATIYHELQRGYTGERDTNQRPAYCAELAQKTVQENFKRRGRRTEVQAQ